MTEVTTAEKKYLEGLRAKVAAFEAIKQNGKTAEQNCAETGICVNAFRNPDFGGRGWFFVTKCAECGVFNCEYNSA